MSESNDRANERERQELRDAVATVKSRGIELQTNIDARMRAFEAHTSRISRLEERARDINQSLVAHTDQIAVLQKSFGELQAAIEALDARIKALEVAP